MVVFAIVVIVYIFSTSQRRLDSFVYAFVILIILVVVVFFLAGIIFTGVKSFRCRMFFIVVTDSWSDASAVAEPGGGKKQWSGLKNVAGDYGTMFLFLIRRNGKITAPALKEVLGSF